MNVSLIKDSFISLHRYLEQNDFAGYEYDDLLGSRLVSALTFDNLYLKIVAVQIAKRSFVNVRPLLGVRKLKSTKALAALSLIRILMSLILPPV